ncbi:NUDIX hydrolase, partial [Acidovorax sp. HMWF018]
MNAAAQAPTFDQWLAGARQAAQQPPAQPRQP